MQKMLCLVLLLVIFKSCGGGGGGNSNSGGPHCGAWSGWHKTGATECKGRPTCVSKGLMGTYDVEEKTRQCRNGTQALKRERFRKCGC